MPDFAFENVLRARGVWPVAGCDEAGRGPLAGPVVGGVIFGLLPEGHALVTDRPFRAPHHTISDAGLVGGGRFRGLEKSAWPITVCCSWMSF